MRESVTASTKDGASRRVLSRALFSARTKPPLEWTRLESRRNDGFHAACLPAIIERGNHLELLLRTERRNEKFASLLGNLTIKNLSLVGIICTQCIANSECLILSSLNEFYCIEAQDPVRFPRGTLVDKLLSWE